MEARSSFQISGKPLSFDPSTIQLNTIMTFKGYINDKDGFEWDFQCSANGEIDGDFDIYDIKITDQNDKSIKLKSLAFMPDIFNQTDINNLEEEIIQAVIDDGPDTTVSDNIDWMRYREAH